MIHWLKFLVAFSSCSSSSPLFSPNYRFIICTNRKPFSWPKDKTDNGTNIKSHRLLQRPRDNWTDAGRVEQSIRWVINTATVVCHEICNEREILRSPKKWTAAAAGRPRHVWHWLEGDATRRIGLRYPFLYNNGCSAIIIITVRWALLECNEENFPFRHKSDSSLLFVPSGCSYCGWVGEYSLCTLNITLREDMKFSLLPTEREREETKKPVSWSDCICRLLSIDSRERRRECSAWLTGSFTRVLCP